MGSGGHVRMPGCRILIARDMARYGDGYFFVVRIFRHYIPSSFLALGLVEVLVLTASVYGGIFIRFGGDLAAADKFFPILPVALLFAFITISAMTAMGLYERHLREGVWGMVLRIIGGLLISFLLMSVVFYLFPSLALWRGAFGLSWLLALLGILGVRLAFAMLADQEALKKRILVLGTGNKAAMIDQLLRRRSDRQGFSIVGYVHFPREHEVVKKNIIQHDSPFLELVRRNHVDEIVVALDDRRKSFPMEEIVDCRMAGVEVIDLADFYRKVWQLGDAGCEVPVTVAREQGPVNLVITSSDRNILLKGPSLH